MKCHDTTADKLLLTVRETKDKLNISERSLYTLTKEGKIPAVRIGRRVLYSPADLERFIEAHKKGGAA